MGVQSSLSRLVAVWHHGQDGIGAKRFGGFVNSMAWAVEFEPAPAMTGVRPWATLAAIRMSAPCSTEWALHRSSRMQAITDTIAKSGGTPLAVAKDGKLLGVVHLKDIVKGGIRERFAELRRMGIRTVMITGDNPMTAAAIAAEAGVDDFLAQATPEDKLRLIRDEQAKGKLVAMCGDGTNDAPALAQADVGVAMNTGTQAAREAGNMIDLDSNPTKLIEVVEIGKQLLMTRGALTTFSIANDAAKYFAIVPAIFLAFYPQLQAGADDYVTKPFGMDELLARMRAALRHQLQIHGERPIFHAGELSVDLVRRIIKVGDEEVKLSPKEYDLLRVLVQHAGKVLTHKFLLGELWDDLTDTQYLRVYVRQLRQKIETDPERPHYILTETGIGYRMRAPD
jgi:soluble P-type ATPase